MIQLLLNNLNVFIVVRKKVVSEKNHPLINQPRLFHFQEAKDKFKGWVSHPWYDSSVEISYKKVKDGYPLRLWRCVVEVNAKPEDIIRRILYERYKERLIV